MESSVGRCCAGDADVLVEGSAALRRRQLVAAEDAIGGEAERPADEDGAEEEGDGLLLGALHGRSQCDRM